jgi:hypothetical protein
VVLKGLSAARVKVAFLFFVLIVVAAVLGVASHTPTSSAQTGYGAPQVIPDQTIKPIGSSHSSPTGLALGVGAGVVILGSAVFFGWRHSHPDEHPYP